MREASVHANVLLAVEQLRVVYDSVDGEICAVNDVDLTLRRGEILGLAGESGSGKSTLAYALARLLRPPARVTAGRVLYYSNPRTEGENPEDEGRDLFALSKKELRAFRWSELAVVFQSAMNALNPVATVEAQINDVLRAHRPAMTREQRRARLGELAHLVGIAAARLKSYPHELSGGMRQRAVIAIALALSPQIIIMDEPTTALDVVIQRDILNELLRLRRQLDFAVIFITHDLSLLLEIADEVLIMYAGRIVERAGRLSLYRRPLHPYTAGLLRSFPTLDGPLVRMSGIPGTPPDLRALPPGCVFHPRCARAWQRCQQERPALLASEAAAEESGGPRQVACHLYTTESQREQQPALRGQGGEA
ncbi:MAG TPA: ABC transporter ATP-binding protein [Ktedonobacteraceae bacterium]|jgi:peptide/nickel transport system ATP-binding protein